KCLSFADPYVEYDTFNLMLDLILLRRGVFRHLVFNRGSKPKRVTAVGPTSEDVNLAKDAEEMEMRRRRNILKIGLLSIFADTFTRWIYHYPLMKREDRSEIRSWNLDDKAGRLLFVTFLGCFLETVSFHIGVVVSSMAITNLLNSLAKKPLSPVQQGVRASHISLTLLYSSFTKLFMLVALSIWHPENISSQPPRSYDHPILSQIVPWLDVDKLDRRWVARNVLGGTTSSFGLRVALESNPFLVIFFIIAGWAIKTWVSSVASIYIGSQASHTDGYLLYALP
ncbi:hypothetical protein M422DRAFT_39857, partial [Sphaerobolus stellatus SS14]